MIGPDGKKVLPDIPDDQFEKDLATDPSIKEDEEKGYVISASDEDEPPSSR